jgi:hypothetical protein
LRAYVHKKIRLTPFRNQPYLPAAQRCLALFRKVTREASGGNRGRLLSRKINIRGIVRGNYKELSNG